MIGEREDFNSTANYGDLTMRSYSIDANEVNAFYDSSNNLIFVLDNTINSAKPNVLLVINPDGDKKWDEILSGDYDVDLETIRPKADNKYQKLDIEYSGLSVYDDLIKAYNAGDSLNDALKQLSVLRDSAVRHSAMMRLNVANEVMAKTNATIVKTKESIIRLQARLKTLRAKLTEAKKGIGRVPTKQSAAKILKLESQIEAINEKLKRAKERLKSAQRRLETATVDAELAGDLLNNQSTEENEKNSTDSLIVAPEHRVAKVENKASLPQIVEPVFDNEEPQEEKEIEYMADDKKIVDDDDKVLIEDKNIKEEVVEEEQSDVKPLFNQDPKILNDEIAFKPISFDAPVDNQNSSVPVLPALEDNTVETEKFTEDIKEEKEETTEKPVLESMTAVEDMPEYKMIMPENFSAPESLPVVEEEKTEVPESFIPEPVVPDARQQEPVFVEKTEERIEEKTEFIPEPVAPKSPAPVLSKLQPTPQFERPVLGNDTYVKNSKPTLTYYLLLIILIVLAVFTLWLYQKNVKVGVPVLTPVVEQTGNTNKQNTFDLKKQKKTSKPVVAEKEENIDDLPVFLDEEPEETNITVDEVVNTEPETTEQESATKEPLEPEIFDDVPARVNTSGQEDFQERNITEDDVLASKPIYEPGAKHDEMFVAEEDYVEPEPDVIYEPESGTEVMPMETETEYVDNNPLYDAEEEQYQQEQADLYYEE